mmetsp:Transcript_9275/g.23090  ORF Transcript_9275/g.23090 Transcript_9275/m.23090 type:complete len:294 (+) Transcript_9275:496-1377(+)
MFARAAAQGRSSSSCERAGCALATSRRCSERRYSASASALSASSHGLCFESTARNFHLISPSLISTSTFARTSSGSSCSSSESSSTDVSNSIALACGESTGTSLAWWPSLCIISCAASLASATFFAALAAAATSSLPKLAGTSAAWITWMPMRWKRCFFCAMPSVVTPRHASSTTYVMKPCSAEWTAVYATHTSRATPQQYTCVTPRASSSGSSDVCLNLELSKKAEYESTRGSVPLSTMKSLSSITRSSWHAAPHVSCTQWRGHIVCGIAEPSGAVSTTMSNRLAVKATESS